MSARRAICIAALATLACRPGVVQGQVGESGAAEAVIRGGGAPYPTPPGMDDAYQPLLVFSEPGRDSYDCRDVCQEGESADPSPTLSERLAELDEEQRAEASIELEYGADITKEQQQAAFAIEQAWNSGRHEEAVRKLRALEAEGVALALGLSWKTAQPIGARGLDVRIGGGMYNAQGLTIDFDDGSGNLFALVRWDDSWSLNISVDGGVSWSQTYRWTASEDVIDADAAVVDDYVYIAYAVMNIPDEARLRRCLTSNGAVDGDYGFCTVIDAGADTIRETALATNADDYDNRIYYLAIQSNDVLRYFWDAASDGKTFVDGGSPAVADARYGLDVTWVYNRLACACDEYLYVSYSGVDGDIHVQGRDESSWTNWNIESGAGSFRTTGVSAYGDVVLCAYEYPYSGGTGIAYRISRTCDRTWSAGSIAVPDGHTIYGYFEPDVDLRSGAGAAIIYQAEAGEIDPMFYRTRAGFAPGAWSDPSMFNDYDVYTGSDTAINYLPPLAGEAFSHGAMYLSLDPDFRTPYFDRPSAGDASCGDVTPPIVLLGEPATLSCVCDYVEITGTVSDPDGSYSGDRLEYRAGGDASWTAADAAYGERSGVLYTWCTASLSEDFYYVRVIGENECGITASDSTLVYKPTSFETLELRSPVNGQVYGGAVCFDGSAVSQSCFDYYTVDYRIGANAFAPVDPPESPYTQTVHNDPLASWNTVAGPTAVSDGQYDVRLRGVTECDDEATIIHTITIDNTPPIAEITEPAPCEFLTGHVDVFGTADDANLSHWRLEYSRSGVNEWHWIADGDFAVNDNFLGRWTTDALPQCAHALRLVVWDLADVDGTGDAHRTEYLLNFNVGCRADINKDGVYNIDDLAELLAYYGGTCP